LSNNIFISNCSTCQHMSRREQEKLIKDYIRARDNYRLAIAKERRAYDELVRQGLLPGDDGKSEQ
jgi:hypothetical protein